jgi:hypothetical protein
MQATRPWLSNTGAPLAARLPRRTQAEDPAGATARLLTEGGDARIALAATGANQYGCPPQPEPDLVAFGSSTASVVSGPAFEAACALHERLHRGSQTWVGAAGRLRQDLLGLTGAAGLAGAELVLAASGTDLHLIAALLATRDGSTPLQAVMGEPAETGSGVPAALSAVRFGVRAGPDPAAAVVAASAAADVSLCAPATVRLRDADGTPRLGAEVDAEFEAVAESVVRSGRHCLVVLTDVSKTGLLAPSPACAQRLLRALGDRVDVLVDACQFRMAPATVRAYLEQGCMVAITGSKFVTGPAFCGALLLPPGVAARARGAPLHGLSGYSARADWPAGWPGAEPLADACNPGLVLRWTAALTELQRLRAVPAPQVRRFLADWGRAVAGRIARDRAFEAVPVPQIRRGPAFEPDAWDGLQTIYPFLVHRALPGGRRIALSAEQTALLQRQLLQGSGHPGSGGRYQLGQPVPCGLRDGRPVSALRICSSARWVTDAARAGLGAEEAIRQAMLALDQVALLAGARPAGSLRP